MAIHKTRDEGNIPIHNQIKNLTHFSRISMNGFSVACGLGGSEVGK